MLLTTPSAFIKNYINTLSEGLSKAHPEYRLTLKQQLWLGFCLMGLLLSNSINWSSYSRLSLGRYTIGALSWMFRHSCINFEFLFEQSTYAILSFYGLTEGVLLFDDTDNERSKNAEKIHGLGNKKTKKVGVIF